jgi:hypothetical protein
VISTRRLATPGCSRSAPVFCAPTDSPRPHLRPERPPRPAPVVGTATRQLVDCRHCLCTRSPQRRRRALARFASWAITRRADIIELRRALLKMHDIIGTARPKKRARGQKQQQQENGHAPHGQSLGHPELGPSYQRPEPRGWPRAGAVHLPDHDRGQPAEQPCRAVDKAARLGKNCGRSL